MGLVVSATGVSAQTLSTSAPLATGVEVKAKVRVEEGTETVRGLVVAATPEGLGLTLGSDSTVWVEAGALARIEVNRGRTAGAGVNKGWKIGAVTAVFSGLVVAGEAESPGVGFLAGAVVGGIAGSLVGALIGAAVGADSWERVW
jgi:hypothetical protein